MRGQRSEVIRITLIHTPLKHCYGLTLQRDEARAVSTLPCDQDIVALQRTASVMQIFAAPRVRNHGVRLSGFVHDDGGVGGRRWRR